MEHTYVFSKNSKAYLVALVTCDDSYGRYHIYTFSTNNVGYRSFETIEEAEKRFDHWVTQGIVDSWAKIVLER